MTTTQSLAERLEELSKKATPGPWPMDDTGDGKRIVIGQGLVEGPNGYEVAEVYSDDCPRDVAEANATLITELVNNLPTILSALRSRDSVIEDCARVAEAEYNRLRAGLQKAAPSDKPSIGQQVDTAFNIWQAIRSLSSHAETAGVVSVPKAALDWLFGEGPDADGHWFGDGNYVEQVKRPFWWRSKFRAMIKAAKGGDE